MKKMNLKLIGLFFFLAYMGGVERVTGNETPTSTEKSLQLNESNSTLVMSYNIKPLTVSKTDKDISKNNKIFENSNKPKNEEKQKKRKKKDESKKNDLKEKQKVTEILQVQSTTSDPFTSTPKIAKRRRRKKRRRKKKHNQNEVFEVTTTKIKSNDSIKTNKDSTVTKSPKRNPDDYNSTSSVTTETVIRKKHDQTLFGVSNSTKLSQQRNRCIENNGGCSQICKEKGKTKCSCFKGYSLTKSRKKCIDVNECKVKNGGCKEICRNTLGAYYCDCPAGLRISDDLKSCQDINECHLRNGHGPCQDTCTNTYGSYICDCSHLNGTRLGTDKHSCRDINECDEGISGCSHLCINTNVGAFCSCPEGMELMSDYETCQDIDECEDESIKNSCAGGCVNTAGSYYCEEVFQNDQSSNKTKIPVCPPLDPPQHGFITCPRNNTLPFDTFAKNRRKIIKNTPGTKCFLICPVGFRLTGGNRFICGISGKWVIKKKGFCTKAPYPKLDCPPNQILLLEEGHEKLTVNFPPPQTNIRWKIVKSYPKWAKELKGELPEGHHSIQFSVTDPTTKLSSTCSFFITIKK